MPAGAYRPCRLAAAGCPLCRGPWLQPVASLQGALAKVGRDCRRPGRGRPTILLLTAFVAKMQQEHIERFYTIQSHHIGREENRRWRPKL
ncbi:hypothetical protein B296_00040359 [Ensete ventricosum]|uniref:Uncharacterized protein n=1 Tax=Ensete ventricosum TaxID=4639 RepID=A0A426WY79_ENSVE|nr:hypothetical protein B296_00040359 [Ensete ventricosum]